MNRKHIAGITFALAGLAATGVAVTTDLAGAETDASTAQPAYLTVVPGEVTPPVKREAAGVRAPNVEKKARQEALAREAARNLAARQAAARKAATDRLARASRSTARAPIVGGDPRGIAQGMLASYGWSASQFNCLDPLWMRESGWRVSASNPSGAYGIPQALPGSKMAGAGADWQTNPATQIEWGLGYIKGRYGSPCGAWAHFQSNGWY